MSGFDERRRLDAMFENGNRVQFEKPVDAVARDWWLAAFHQPFDLTPEAMGDLLTKSIEAQKSIIYRYIDGERHAFALRVEGRLGDGGAVWFVERSLELEGSIFNAEEMLVPPGDDRQGRGRKLMGDLMAAADMLGISRIALEAQLIGRYAWLRAGFVPNRISWGMIQLDVHKFLQRHAPALGERRTNDLLGAVMRGEPRTARAFAALADPVPSRQLYDDDGRSVMLPMGKAFFLEYCQNWSGEFSFDPESRRIADEYVGSADPV